MNVTNVVYAVFGSSRHTVTEKLHQWDKGQVLKFKNLSGLPEYYAVHFSNERVGGVAKTFIGNSNGVGGWDEYLETGKPVYAWLYLSAGEDDGKTMRSVEIPVIKRPRPVDIEPTPQEQSQIDVIIDALNTGVARAETAATNAETSEANAKTSEDNAKESELNAKAYEEAALQAKDDAEAAEQGAEEAADRAESSERFASDYADDASDSATLSQSWAVGGTGTRQGEDTNNAKYYAESTISAKDEAVLAKTQAESARDTAVQAKNSAQASSQTATQKASEASQSAANASQSASSASASSASASQSAALATSAKEDAQTAQGLAEDAKDEAVTAKEEAETAQQEAEEAAQSIAQSAQQIETNTQDISDLKSAVNNMYPTDTASGAIASFPDGANDVPVDSLKVDIEPVQDLHGYEYPWPAGGGVNLLDLDKATLNYVGAYGFSISRNGDYIVISGTATQGGNLGFNVIINYADGSLSGKGYRLQVFNVTSGYTVGSVWGFRTESERSFAIRLDNITAGQTVNVSMRLSVAATSQSAWTPYSNICPISGHTKVSVVRCGKNLCDPDKIIVGKYVRSGAVSDSTPLGAEIDSPSWSCSDYIKVAPSTQYTTAVPAYTSASAAGLVYFDKNKNALSGVPTANQGSADYTFTTPVDCSFVRFSWNNRDGNDAQFAVGGASSYEPYQGETYIIQLGDTIYGGVLDVTTGELTVDRAMVDLGSLTWTRNGYFFISTGLSPRAANYWGVTQKSNVICSQYTAQKWNDIASNVIDYSCGAYENQVRVSDSRYSTGAELKAALSGVTMVYELETPITISLTPQQVNTLFGTNNIFADTGDTDVTYKANIQLYIQKKISAAVAALS